MHRRPTAALGTTIAGVLALGVVAAVTRPTAGGVRHPDRWDPRVVDLVAFVEQARDLEFRHPVQVEFLSPQQYSAETTQDDAGLDDDDRQELDRYAGELRALGLASGEVDLFAAYNQVSDGGTLAFYDPKDERVRVRGTRMTVGLEVTLVHELTHALQDQRFDLERLYDPALDSGAATAFRGLIEGDATRIEDAYISEALSADEQAAYDTEYSTELDKSEASTADVPAFVNATFGVPYLLGQPFAVMLANQGGNAAVNEAFRHPPDTEEHLFDPASFLAEEEATSVDLGLSDAVEVFDDGPFGSPAWYLVLAERIDPKLAFDAALGWDGDAYALYERRGRTCVRAAFAGDTRADETAMAEAIERWVAALPGGRARSVELDGHPGLEACDPGPKVDMALSGQTENALFLPSLWGYLIADASGRMGPAAARCYAGQVLGTLSYDQITDPAGAAFQGDAFQRVLVKAFGACA